MAHRNDNQIFIYIIGAALVFFLGLAVLSYLFTPQIYSIGS